MFTISFVNKSDSNYVTYPIGPFRTNMIRDRKLHENIPRELRLIMSKCYDILRIVYLNQV